MRCTAYGSCSSRSRDVRARIYIPHCAYIPVPLAMATGLVRAALCSFLTEEAPIEMKLERAPANFYLK